jgi:hypothetical protein
VIKLLPNDNDNLEFIQIVQSILDGFIQSHTPKEIYIIKIDNWFDFKWRSFAGKILGIAGVRSKELIVPPFNPNRVLEQSHFQKFGETYEKQDAPAIHFYQPSEENLSRKLRYYSDSSMFFWFSGNTQNTFRGSIMIYQIEDERESSWYISFLKKEKWQIYKTGGISRNEVLALI